MRSIGGWAAAAGDAGNVTGCGMRMTPKLVRVLLEEGRVVITVRLDGADVAGVVVCRVLDADGFERLTADGGFERVTRRGVVAFEWRVLEELQVRALETIEDAAWRAGEWIDGSAWPAPRWELRPAQRRRRVAVISR